MNKENKTLKDKKPGIEKKEAVVIFLSAIGLIVSIALIVLILGKHINFGTKNAKAGSILSEEETLEMDKRIDKAIDGYLTNLSESLTDEEKAALGRDILRELSQDMSDEEIEVMKEVLVELFNDSNFNLIGTAYFTDEARNFIKDKIRDAVHEALVGIESGSSEYYVELQTAIERIVSENMEYYGISQADIEYIRQSVLASLGNIKGEKGAKGDKGDKGDAGLNGRDGVDGKDGIDGKNGENGKDGRDGRDGKDGVNGTNGRDGKDGINGTNGRDGKDGKDGADGYTPIKGTDYFTEEEIENIITTIVTHTESHVDEKNEEAIVEITYNIKTEVTEIFNESLQQAIENFEIGITELNEHLTEEINVNVTTLEETINNLEESVNNKFSTLITSINDTFFETAESFNNALNLLKIEFNNKLNELSSKHYDDIKRLNESTDAKIKDIQDNEATFELILNSDGTYTLKITDPKN